MKYPWTVNLFLVVALAVPAAGGTTHMYKASSTFDESAIQTRLTRLTIPVTAKYTTTVKDHIFRYVTYGRRDAEKMLARRDLYFPVFEYYLNQYQLPEELKYLPIVESNLLPHASSSAGAAGLWQLMPSTAKHLGLRINWQMDERKDVYKSTEAAVSYLAELFQEFKSWELALAAYNCGPGNVRKAIRNSGSRDYWKLRPYLPSETQKYIPRFIAASYIAEYYTQHDLLPERVDYELQFTRTIKVYSQVNLKKIATLAEVPLQTIRKLNPAYVHGYIPANSQGNYLILPAMGMMAFKDKLRWSGNQSIKTDLPELASKKANLPGPTVVMVEKGDSLDHLSNMYGCSPNLISSWNGLATKNLYYRQELLLYLEPRT
jgi:membrane-bound lytic murein transglycosylase D